MSSSLWSSVRKLKPRRIAGLVVAALAVPLTALAQENSLGPPDVLQYPVEAGVNAPRAMSNPFLLYAIESAADLALCQVLMTEAGKPIPTNFSNGDCPAEYATKVKNSEGLVHWDTNARPLKCTGCIGRPSMTRTEFLDKPNLRRAMLYGRLNFIIDPPGPTNRGLSYGFQVFYTCKAVNGARTGDFVVDVKMDPPVISEPGTFEAALDFFLGPANVSRFIERQIRANLKPIGSTSLEYDTCSSVGVSRAQDPKFDSVMYDPVTTKKTSINLPEAAVISDRARIRFLKLTRNPLPPLVDASHAAPGYPSAAQFSVYLNGAQALLPSKAPSPANLIELPPAGGSIELNYCRTIDLSGSDRLQLLFVNGLGGAVWSQFPRAGSFGNGGLKTLSTGRSIVVPARPGAPAGSKPQPMTLREFDLTYTIEYMPAPSLVAAKPAKPPKGGKKPGFAGAGNAAKPTEVLAADPGGAPAQPCREI